VEVNPTKILPLGLDAVWIKPVSREHCTRTLGYTVVDAATVVATQPKPIGLTKMPINYLGYEEVQPTLDLLAKNSPN